MAASDDLYQELLGVTRAYLSDASVRAAVGTALDRSGQAGLTPENLPEVVAEAMVGLRLVCEPERFGDLMMDLTEYCERLGPRANRDRSVRDGAVDPEPEL